MFKFSYFTRPSWTPAEICKEKISSGFGKKSQVNNNKLCAETSDRLASDSVRLNEIPDQGSRKDISRINLNLTNLQQGANFKYIYTIFLILK